MTAPWCLDDVALAHRRAVALVDGLPDDVIGRPSLLPGWTVGHVLAHLCRNADSLTGMLVAGAAGEVGDQYPGGAAQRSADIERGAPRSAAAHAADLRRACADLEAAWSAMPDGAWSGEGRALAGPVVLHDVPFRRWRETEVHLVDLGLSYRPDDWPRRYVDEELKRSFGSLRMRVPEGVSLGVHATDTGQRWSVGGAATRQDSLPLGSGVSIAIAAPSRDLLAWVLGRADPPPALPFTLLPW